MKRIPAFALAVLALAVLAGCSGGGAGDRPVVRVGYMANVSHAAPLAGFSRERGSFAKAMPSVALEPRVFATGAESLEGIRAGTVDMAYVGPGPAITAYWEARDVVIVSGSVSGGSVLVVRSEAGIETVDDLKGKTVGVPHPGNSQDVLLRYQLALHGLRTAETGGPVTVLAVPAPEILARFQSGELDAALVPEPWGSRLEREAGARALLGSAEIFNEGAYPAAVLVARKVFAEQNPEIVRAFAEANRTVVEEIGADRDGTARILTGEIRRHTGQRVSEEDVRRGLRRCAFTPDITQHAVHVFANLVEVAGYKADPTASLDGILWSPAP